MSSFGSGGLDSFQRDFRIANEIARLASDKKGTAFFVGGFVRDRILKRENKDIDMEIHGIPVETLEKLLGSFGEVIFTGKSFGVYGIKGSRIDVAVPRTERAADTGREQKSHTDFEVTVDPFIGLKQAAERRDFTVNALMENVLTGEILDFFGGMEDIRSRTIRHVSDKSFPEDPLRVLRAAQFAARLGFDIAAETVSLCSEISLSHLSKERVWEELRKALLQSPMPSVFFESLRTMGKLSEWFGELEDTVGVVQNYKYHQEGDVWTHTMMVLDRAAGYADRVSCPESFMLAALCHDLGKCVSTVVTDGVAHAHGHAESGVAIADKMLSRITDNKKLRRRCLCLVKNHMKPFPMALDNSSVKSTNKLFDSCPDPEALVYLALSDSLGKIPSPYTEESERFLLERLEIYRRTMAEPYVTGKDLEAAGLTPSESFSELLAYSHKLRLAGIDKQTALRQTLSYASKHKIT